MAAPAQKSTRLCLPLVLPLDSTKIDQFICDCANTST